MRGSAVLESHGHLDSLASELCFNCLHSVGWTGNELLSKQLSKVMKAPAAVCNGQIRIAGIICNVQTGRAAILASPIPPRLKPVKLRPVTCPSVQTTYSQSPEGEQGVPPCCHCPAGTSKFAALLILPMKSRSKLVMPADEPGAEAL